MNAAGKTISLTIMILLLTVLLSLGSACAVEISFRPSATVDGAQIRLGDIADLSDSSVLAKALASLVVGQAPDPGQAVLVSADAVKQYLATSNPIPAGTVWQGASAIGIKRNAQQIKPQYLLDLIKDYLKDNRNNLPDAAVRFVPDSLPLPFFLPVGELTPEIIPSNPNILGSSRFSIIFRIGSEVVKNMSVRGTVEAIAQVVVSVRKLTRGTILSHEDLTLSAVDISDLQRPGFQPEDFIGMKLTRSLRAGTPIVDTMVDTLPVVHRGEKVKILVQSGALQITATGLAHSDGKINQMIRVQNISSNKVLLCRVTAPGLVEVML